LLSWLAIEDNETDLARSERYGLITSYTNTGGESNIRRHACAKRDEKVLRARSLSG